MHKTYDKFKEVLEKSSNYNNKLLLFFISFLFYVLTIVASTTDLMLLLPNSDVLLPLLNVKVPIFVFYIIAPILILIFHFYLLLNLLHHSRKLNYWNSNNGINIDIQTPLYIFNLQTNIVRNSSQFLYNFIIWFIYYFVPVFSLLLIQFRFADYHSIEMSTFHFLFVILDFAFLFFFWKRITEKKFNNIKFDNFKEYVKQFTINKNGVIKKSLSFGRIIPNPIAFILIFSVSVYYMIVIILIKNNYILIPILMFSYPNIEVNEKVLTSSPPSEMVIQEYIAQGKNLDSAWFEHSTGIDLKNRDLRYAKIIECKLLKADFTNSNLNDAQFNKSNFSFSKFKHSNLIGSQIIESKAISCIIDSSNFSRILILNSNFDYSYIENSFFYGSVTKNSNLKNCKFRSDYLSGSIVLNSTYDYSEFTNFNLNSSYMFSSSFKNAQINYIIINGSLIYDVNIENTNLGFPHIDYGAKPIIDNSNNIVCRSFFYDQNSKKNDYPLTQINDSMLSAFTTYRKQNESGNINSLHGIFMQGIAEISGLIKKSNYELFQYLKNKDSEILRLLRKRSKTFKQFTDNELK